MSVVFKIILVQPNNKAGLENWPLIICDAEPRSVTPPAFDDHVFSGILISNHSEGLRHLLATYRKVPSNVNPSRVAAARLGAFR